ncbi:putative membrane protein YedE/YeeE [Azospirillum lipoferum]|uniref:YeeE/YedE family protein n=1 Tax=Azospirillum lipoferum TaxID=193 RepID=A0A5A9GVT3_AZOLI|nr:MULTISPECIES: YeeE/YedE thiosulfate transporter family protein [Azospirillum]KAA0597549.1 YeeE/YedE family protein [Azospirillum lipoferum]MCP1610337.1 putative membrane protein YedE/YeeE [Azospirillum lipoferum]MDW5534170.1 YeeE/YedE thiosulfate transporter family protein [Azospirillum sp. NL1]
MAGPIEALAGGALIGAAAAGMLLVNGRIAGISGILARAVRPGVAPWQWAFVAGLLAAGLAARLSGIEPTPAFALLPVPMLIAAGLIVGIGTRIGSGCTSGHGVCGLANLSPRSLVATLVFMAVAAATVFVTRHL